MKSNIICTTCGIINISIPYNLKSEINNWLILQLKEIQKTGKTLWNKFNIFLSSLHYLFFFQLFKSFHLAGLVVHNSFFL